MNVKDSILFNPRKFNSIALWHNIAEAQWTDPAWQLRNSIRSVGQLKRVITLNSFQEKEIERTFQSLKSQGKEPMRITPYYASLMQADPFHPVMLPGEREEKQFAKSKYGRSQKK